MKKVFLAIAVFTIAAAISGCSTGETVGSVSEKESEISSVSIAEEFSEDSSDSEGGEAETAASPEISDTEEKVTTAAAKETKVPKTTETAAVSTSAETETAPTEPPAPTLDDEDEEKVYAAARTLFEKACETEWNFTVESPYTIDPEQSIENKYGWLFYLVTDPGINSVDDVRNDYHKFFSSGHTDYLGDLYLDNNGRVYCLNGARGSHILYEGFELSGMEKSSGKISFTATVNYSDDGFGNGPYSEKFPFTAVKEDGVWKVLEFKLPY